MYAKYTKKLILGLITILASHTVSANGSMITGYVSTPPRSVVAQTGGQMPRVGGIPFVTSGCLDWSNNDGLFKLPKYHNDMNIRLVVVKPDEFLLKEVKSATVSHPELAPGTTARCYRIEKKQDKKKDWYYQAHEEKTPENNRLFSTDLVLLSSEPEAIMINTQEKFFSNEEQGQFVVPQNMITTLWDTTTDVQHLTRFLEQPEVAQKEDGGGKSTPPTQTYTIAS